MGAGCSRRGGALLEVMIALMVFACMMITFASSIIIAKSSSKMNGQYAQAISLCQHKVDQLRAVGFGRLNYTELNDAGIVDDTPTQSPYSFVVSDDVSSYLYSATATLTLSTVAGTNNDVILATVTISWKASPHRQQNSVVTVQAQITNVD